MKLSKQFDVEAFYIISDPRTLGNLKWIDFLVVLFKGFHKINSLNILGMNVGIVTDHIPLPYPLPGTIQ